jgi:hypothetical protein
MIQILGMQNLDNALYFLLVNDYYWRYYFNPST